MRWNDKMLWFGCHVLWSSPAGIRPLRLGVKCFIRLHRFTLEMQGDARRAVVTATSQEWAASALHSAKPLPIEEEGSSPKID